MSETEERKAGMGAGMRDAERHSFTRTGTFVVMDGVWMEVATWEQDSTVGDGDRDFIIAPVPVDCPYCALDEACALHVVAS